MLAVQHARGGEKQRQSSSNVAVDETFEKSPKAKGAKMSQDELGL